MRILLLTTHLNIGGITTYTVELAKALKAKGSEVYVASSGGVLVPELTTAGVSHIKIDIFTKSELSPKVFKAIIEVYKLARALKIDVIHAQTRVTQVIASLVSRMAGIKSVSTCHGFFKMNLGRFLFPAWGDNVIAISEPVKAHLEKDFRVNKKRISLIYNGIDVKKFLKDMDEKEKDELRAKFGIKKGVSVIGTIARFTPDKGHDVIISAFREILKNVPSVVAVFVGDGKEKQKVVGLVESFNLVDKIIFVPPQINTINILSIMDVFMFVPKRREGLGLVLLEALSMGKPIVATNVGGIPNVVKDGINGFLVEPSRPDLLVGPTLRLLKDKELCKDMARSGREIVIQKFSINGMVDKVEEVYKQ